MMLNATKLYRGIGPVPKARK